MDRSRARSVPAPRARFSLAFASTNRKRSIFVPMVQHAAFYRICCAPCETSKPPSSAELTLRICGSLDIDRALDEAFSYLRQRMPADAIGLGFNNLDQPGEDPKVVVVASAGRPGARYLWRHPASQLPIPPAAAEQTRAAGPEGPVAWAINRPEDLHPALHGVFPGVAHSSALFLRLELTDGLTGVLLISAEGHDRYTPAHVRLVESVREPVAIAMANARRYRELSQLRDLLAEDNRALTADIQRAVGVEVVGADFGLRTVMEQVRQVAPAGSAASRRDRDRQGGRRQRHSSRVAAQPRAHDLHAVRGHPRDAARQ